MKLFDIADVIRSKNAGPYELTFDIIFKTDEFFQMVSNAKVINKTSFAKLYNISEDDILGIIDFPPAKAIKITIKRPICSGDLGETDVYGAQQHIPLMNFEFEI
ncbi:MAG: DUF4387 domain-containing protein [Lachnospirales bacterium]